MRFPRRTGRVGRRIRWSALLVSALIAVGSITAAGHGAAEVVDDFYTPPAGFESSAPGAILASRPVTTKMLLQFPVNAQAWQLLYRTTDGEGRPYAAVTTVLIPRGPAVPRPLLSLQMAYDAVQRECMPSHTLTHGDLAGMLNGQKSGWSTVPAEMTRVAAGLAKGWAVAVPDPGGVDDRFLTPNLMGYTTLDGIRAARNFAPLGLAADTRVAAWGYSGGGVATSWAAQVQPRYAPELNMVGFAIGAPVQDLGAAIRTADGRYTVGLAPLGLASISKDSPEFAARLDSYLTPAGRTAVAGAGVECTATIVSAHRFKRVSEWVNAPIEEILADPVLAGEVDARKRGAETPRAPLYVVNGVNDEVSWIGGTDDLVARYCADGASITYLRDATPDSVIGAHGMVALTASSGAMAWVARALEGEGPVQGPGCTTTTVATTANDPANATAMPEFANAVLAALVGQALGAQR
ncbi:lipase family protein [Nocardia sp. NPDC058518]|uniref:lipase family protein n=1 Tax=Nocardia sp. NPDC058518 TaxID=3346534 RepID=UPI0036541649